MKASKQATTLAAVLLSLLLLSCASAKDRRLRRPREDTRVNDDMTRNLLQTKVPVLLQVDGQPGLLNEFEYVVLEETFIEAYNSLAQNLCPDTSVPLVETVTIDRDVGNSASPGDGTVSRIFTLSSRITLPSVTSLFSPSQDIAVRRQLTNDKDPKPRRLSHGGKGGKGKGKSKQASKNPVTAPTMTSADESTRTGCPGLTEQAFALAYREAVRAKSGELGTSVVDVTDVAEMGPVACDTSAIEFTSDVVITFTGDPTLWSLSQEQGLTQSFGQTYRSLNRLNPDTCDLLFRDVFNVALFRDEEFNRRLRVEEESHNKAQRSLQASTTFSYLYRATGECRGCQANSRLFAQGSSGRKLLASAQQVSFADTHRRLQDDTCMCPVTASELRPPTNEEFRDAYEATISILQKENVIDKAFIGSIVDVKEVRQVDWDCSATETFETQVYVQLSGTPSAVENDEIEALEVGFTETYKQLSGSFCDPFFRTPIEVTIDTMTGVGRRLQSDSSFTYEYTVSGLCRGCAGNSRLFGQSVRRMLSRGDGRRFQQDNLCFCSLDSVADRAPTQDEFAVAYNETVKELTLANIRHVVSVNEQDFAAADHDESDGNEPSVDVTLEVVTTTTTTYQNKPTPAPAETAVGASDLTARPTCSPTQ